MEPTEYLKLSNGVYKVFPGSTLQPAPFLIGTADFIELRLRVLNSKSDFAKDIRAQYTINDDLI